MCSCMLSHFSCVWFFLTPRTVACQVPQSVGFSKQEYWSRLSCPPPQDLPDPGIKPKSLLSPALAGRYFATRTTGKPQLTLYLNSKRLKLYLLRPGTRQQCLCSLLLFNILLEVLASDKSRKWKDSSDNEREHLQIIYLETLIYNI